MERDALAEERLATTRRRNEAHVLTVGFRRRAQAELSCERTNFGLGHVANGKEGALEFTTGQHVHHVRLILCRVTTTVHAHLALGVGHEPCVMSGNHGIEAEGIGALGEARELQAAVAFDARVGCDASGVRVHVRVDDLFLKVIGEVEDEMVDVELLRDTTGIIDVGHRTTTGIAFAAPQSHRHPDDVMALALHEGSGDRRVDPTRHRHEHLHGMKSKDVMVRLGCGCAVG